jgi:hypothetical protein
MTPEGFRAFVDAAPFRFAKTMPTVPHFYTLRREHPGPEGQAAFGAAVQFIREHGYRGRWGRHVHDYYEPGDGYVYWTMGAPVADTILINRASLDEPRSVPTRIEE